MKTTKTMFLLILIVFLFSLPVLSLGKDEEEGIPLSQVPKNVIRAAEMEVSGIKLLDAKMIKKDDGQIFYQLNGALGQEAYEVMVDSKGNVQAGGSAKEIKSDVPISKVPGNILLAAREEVKGLKVIKAQIIEGKDGNTLYEIYGDLGQDTYRIRVGLSADIIDVVINPRNRRR